MKNNKISPEKLQRFFNICGRALAIAAILLLIVFSFQKTKIKEAEYFWQIDPELCIHCGRCETECVLQTSAVKCVHDVKICGYCDLCGGYYRTNAKELNTAAENLSCPTGAIQRKFIEEPYFEYTINEDLCTGCGKCAKGCNDFGNGSLYLQIKQDLCKNCNECQIAKNCPTGAIKRVPASQALSLKTSNQNRFPKPDFESGYVYPKQHHTIPNEALWAYMDIAILVLLMSFVAGAVIKKQIRWSVIFTSIISVGYFGFYRHGCVCSIGAIQNVALSLTNHTYTIPLFVMLLFILPIIFALLFGRVFCAGVCPIGALQELVNIKNYKLSKTISKVLGIFPWIYLGFAVLFAITNSRFIICRFDPFVGIFRLGGELPLILFGVLLLIFSIFTGRPFCRFICPYGVILSLFSRISFFKIKITKKECINCQLCHNACPVDAIHTPYDNKVKENRSTGMKRILRYLVFLPIIIITGAMVMYLLSDNFSKVHQEVRLYDMVIENEAHPQAMQSLELQAFYGQKRTVAELETQVIKIKKEFRIASTIVGAFFGLIISLTLIHLSTKRTRKLYEIDYANCVECGRCFGYCPQNLKEKIKG
ncbi:MAG: 4Fe-4S binding protein [Lentimicrobiaceae bacterium]|nr:4Fe-4S binding protein [Lentimicrobiaceae bacterium]